MLRFAEEISLLLLDEERGETVPLNLPRHTFNTVLAGAVLMDLALEERIDTDLEHLVLVDPAPLEDGLLDPTLADIARASRTHDTGYWVERTSRRADDIHDAALARLMERGIIEDDVPGLFFLSSRVARSRRYPAIDGKSVDDVRLRVMRILFEDDVPDPRDIAIICLADACGIVTEQICTLIAGVSAQGYLDDLILFFTALLKARMTHHSPGLLMRRPRVQRARRRLNELYRKVLADHEPEKRGGRDPDMIDDLLELHRTDPVFMPEVDLVISVLGPFFAGIDTAANVCAFMLYETLRHPDLRERMTAEADAFFTAPGEPTAGGLRALDVTHRVAMETLRMHPVAPALTRTVTNAFDFEGYAIPAGTRVIIGSTVPHGLPDCFPDPERFDIERYTAARAEHRVPGAYAPFGLGMHRCLGNGFAETQIVLTMATILRDVAPALDPPDYRLRVEHAPTPHPADSFRFRQKRRRE